MIQCVTVYLGLSLVNSHTSNNSGGLIRANMFHEPASSNLVIEQCSQVKCAASNFLISLENILDLMYCCAEDLQLCIVYHMSFIKLSLQNVKNTNIECWHHRSLLCSWSQYCQEVRKHSCSGKYSIIMFHFFEGNFILLPANV